MRANPSPLIYEHFHLVVSAPKSQRSVVTNSLDVVDDLLLDILVEFRCELVNGTSKHEVLPDDKSELIAGIPEGIKRIMTAAPNTDSVVVSVLGLL